MAGNFEHIELYSSTSLFGKMDNAKVLSINGSWVFIEPRGEL